MLGISARVTIMTKLRCSRSTNPKVIGYEYFAAMPLSTFMNYEIRSFLRVRFFSFGATLDSLLVEQWNDEFIESERLFGWRPNGQRKICHLRELQLTHAYFCWYII